VLSVLLRPWIASCQETALQLSDYLDDELDTRTRNRITRHLARCERCRALAASLGRILAQLRSLGAAQPVAAAPTSATVSSVLSRIRQEPR
jgi:anti-sigma factor RsiW